MVNNTNRKMKNTHYMKTSIKNIKLLLLSVAALATYAVSAQTNYSAGTNAGNAGGFNTALGVSAGDVITANDITVTGYRAGAVLLDGGSSSFYGSLAGSNVTRGPHNTFIGYNTGGAVTTGGYNVAVGSQAGTFGAGNVEFNVALGYFAGNLATGKDNVFGGFYAGASNTGSYNVYFGETAGRNSGASSYSVALGFQSGQNATGSNNVFLGKQAGYGETGSDKLYIENSLNLATPLIYGDFAANQLSINAKPTAGYTLSVGGKAYVNGNATVAGVLNTTNNIIVGGNAIQFDTEEGEIQLMSSERYLFISNQNNGRGRGGIKASGSLIADDPSYANPEPNDLIVKGRIGIGTNFPANTNGYQLAVNGKIGAHDLQIEANSDAWPDYVFSQSYNLPRLTEVEKYVAENKHLEGVPSAEEVQKNGHSVAQMDAILLKKVEELTLYIIQQQKQLEAQQKELDALKKLLKN